MFVRNKSGLRLMVVLSIVASIGLYLWTEPAPAANTIESAVISLNPSSQPQQVADIRSLFSHGSATAGENTIGLFSRQWYTSVYLVWLLIVIVAAGGWLLLRLRRANLLLENLKTALDGQVQRRTEALHKTLFEVDRSREMILSILQSVQEILLVVDNEFRIVLMNRHAREFLGITVFVPFQTQADLTSCGLVGQQVLAKVRDTLAHSEASFLLDYDDNGTLHHFRGSVNAIGSLQGDFSGFVIMLVDDTKQQNLRKIKDEFLSRAAHELRTPLTSITGFSELLVTRADLKEEQRLQFAQYIYDKSLVLRNLVNQLMDIQDVESGHGIDLQIEDVDINEFIKEHMKKFAQEHPDIRLHFSVPSQPTIVQADRERLAAILDNILDNSVLYSSDDPVIGVEVVLSDMIEVLISDNGVGMSLEQKDQIFEKFYSADSSDSSRAGPGLGMTYVLQTMKIHGGDCEVKSVLDLGTTVKLRFPEVNEPVKVL